MRFFYCPTLLPLWQGRGNYVLELARIRARVSLEKTMETQLVISPAMVDAGVQELFEGFSLSGDHRDLVTQIFLSMAFESPQLSQLLPQSSGVLALLQCGDRS